MSRQPLSDDCATIIRRFKLPLILDTAFEEQCTELGLNPSAQLRSLIEHWLYQTAAIQRLKRKTK